MPQIPASAQWAPIDIDLLCRVWEADKDGTDRRQRNNSLVLRACAGQLRHLQATARRVLMRQWCKFDQRQTVGADPLHQWRYSDDVKNSQTQRWRIAGIPRSSGSGDAYGQRESDTGSQSKLLTGSVGSPAFPDDVFYDELIYERGAESDAAATEGFSTFNNYAIMDLLVQSEPLSFLDTATHDYVVADSAMPNSPCLANVYESLRAAFHELRSKNLPIVANWAAQGGAAGWTQPASSDLKGLVMTSTSWTNVFDGTSTSRTATSRGFPPLAYLMGRGVRTKDWGKKVAVQMSFLAEAVTQDGSLRTLGPDFISPNQHTALTWTAGAGASWKDAVDYVYLDSSIDISDTTTARNKLDVQSQLVSGGTLYIYGVRGWVVWAA
jgi:hypothetical protein